MLKGQVDARLERRLRELYDQHAERAARIDWSYYDFLPINFNPPNREDLFNDEIIRKPNEKRGQLSPEIYLAVETALLTEVNLPWFTTELYTTFKGSLQVLIDFVHTWTAEEDQHSCLLDTYLLMTNNGDALARRKLRKEVISIGHATGLESPLETMVYTTIQERATMVFYLNVAQACESQDPGLAAVLRRLAKDETLHFAFYRDAALAHIQMDPNMVELVTSVMLKFQMPGSIMPNYEQRMAVIAKHAHYGPTEYYTQVVDELVKYWDIPNLKPDYLPAQEAQRELLAYHNRLGRIAARLSRQTGKIPSQEETADRYKHGVKNGVLPKV